MRHQKKRLPMLGKFVNTEISAPEREAADVVSYRLEVTEWEPGAMTLATSQHR